MQWGVTSQASNRHEAWHVVQACYGGQIISDELIAKHAHPDDVNDLRFYPESQHKTELAARNVARYTNEDFVIKGIRKFCF